VLTAAPEAVAALTVDTGSRGREISEVIAVARRAGVAVNECVGLEIDTSGGRGAHRGVVASLRPFAYAELSSIVEAGPDLIVVLDCVQDPRNLGAILRTAKAAGAGGLVLPRDRAVSVTAAVVRGAAGHAYGIPVARVTNLVRALDTLRSAGWWVLGLSSGAGASLYEVSLPGRVVVVVGGEEKGIRPLVSRYCDELATLPMAGGVESLNASVAAGVALYEVRRRRQGR